MERAQKKADHAIIEAEKFQARIETPDMDVNQIEADQVNKVQVPFNLLNIGSGVSDDDFFHLTCHIDPNLIHKIEKGSL